jgi:ribonuclease HII
VDNKRFSKLSRQESNRIDRLRLFERRAHGKGYRQIAGIDEAGRGPLAGPVVAAACIVPEHVYLEGVDDSKRLTPNKRQKLYKKIQETPSIIYGIGMVDVLLIDQINILRATLRAMMLAVANLKNRPDYLLIDGSQLPETDIPAESIIEGDSRSVSIATASILAKCTRDALMVQLHDTWPQYGFDQHKGYGTPDHLEAIRKHGPCPIHRMTFEPLKSI